MRSSIVWLSLALGLASSAHAEDFTIQSNGKSIRVIKPSGRSSKEKPPSVRQGLWFVEDAPTSQVQQVDAIQLDNAPGPVTPKDNERYTVGEARERLAKAKAQLEKDKATLVRLEDEADPHKLEMWRARIAAVEKIVIEKEMALNRIERRYVNRLRRERDSKLYDDQSQFYQHLNVDADLSFK